jgi:HEAT repeat protein
MKEVFYAAYKEAPYKYQRSVIRRSDSRSTAELIALALTSEDEDGEYEYIRILQDRGTADVLQAARILCLTGSIRERVLATDILGQIRVADPSQQAEPVTILLALLEREQDPDVLSSALLALGHWPDPRIIAPVAQFADHPDSGVRYGVVCALLSRREDHAIATLIARSDDEDSHVRDWATFGLGSLIETDTPAIREALYARVDDVDDDTRGEALCGLAQRGDPRLLTPLLRELAALAPEEVGSLLVEAAVEAALRLRDPRLYPALVRLQAVAPSYEEDDLEAALKGCWNKLA